jgi:BolA protein
MTRADKIENAIREAFAPRRLEVVDDSESHRGHAGYQDGGESHFNVVVEAEAFASLSLIGQHRAVHEAIGKDLMAEIHALALTTRA